MIAALFNTPPLRVASLAALVFCALCGGLRADPIVVVLSWDGVRHDYPERAEFPGLSRLQSEGVRARRLTPVYPSKTFPGHVSIATGTYPDVHGIVDNHFFDRERGEFLYGDAAAWMTAEPLWIAAERQGVPAATYYWVGSASDWRGAGVSYRVAPFDADTSEDEKVSQLLTWLALPEDQRPRLIMSYWAGADAAGHRYGPDSDRIVEQLQGQDAQLQRLLAGIDELGLWERLTLLLVSDHGMTTTGRWLDVEGVLEEAGIGARSYGGALAHIFLDDPDDLDRAMGVLFAVQPAWAYTREQVPASWRVLHPGRAGDLLMTTEPPYSFTRPRGLGGKVAPVLARMGWTLGGHGYFPHLPDMGGIFMALGRGVPAGASLPAVHQVDVAPTVSRLLSIDPPLQSEGRPIEGIGGEPDAPPGSQD